MEGMESFNQIMSQKVDKEKEMEDCHPKILRERIQAKQQQDNEINE